MKSRNKKINFYPGPSMLPPEVLAEAAENFLEYNQEGVSIVEMNVCFNAINVETEKRFLEYVDNQNIIGIKGYPSKGDLEYLCTMLILCTLFTITLCNMPNELIGGLERTRSFQRINTTQANLMSM